MVALAVATVVLAAPGLAFSHPGDSVFDRDHDGIQDDADNCPDHGNPSQLDSDGDGAGDACDPDDDGDLVGDETDNCPFTANPTQADLDGDGRGDLCDPDRDGDGFTNGTDNCPRVANRGQGDADADGIGDACDSSPSRPGGTDTAGGGGDDPTTENRGGGHSGGTVTGSDPMDRVPPRARLVTTRVHDVTALAYGLPLPVTCEEACAISAQLEIDGSTARRLRLGPRTRPAVIASGAARLGARGVTYVVVRFNPKALRRLRSVRATRPRLQVTIADGADNRKILYRRLALRS